MNLRAGDWIKLTEDRSCYLPNTNSKFPKGRRGIIKGIDAGFCKVVFVKTEELNRIEIDMPNKFLELVV